MKLYTIFAVAIVIVIALNAVAEAHQEKKKGPGRRPSKVVSSGGILSPCGKYIPGKFHFFLFTRVIIINDQTLDTPEIIINDLLQCFSEYVYFTLIIEKLLCSVEKKMNFNMQEEEQDPVILLSATF